MTSQFSLFKALAFGLGAVILLGVVQGSQTSNKASVPASPSVLSSDVASAESPTSFNAEVPTIDKRMFNLQNALHLPLQNLLNPSTLLQQSASQSTGILDGITMDPDGARIEAPPCNLYNDVGDTKFWAELTPESSIVSVEWSPPLGANIPIPKGAYAFANIVDICEDQSPALNVTGGAGARMGLAFYYIN